MGSLALVRHGQASFGAAEYDRLSDRGVEQARALGRRWAAAADAPTVLYSGPMRRQLDTARLAREAAAAGGRALPEPIEVAGLAEMPAFELIARCLPHVARDHVELRALVDGSAAGSARAALFDLAFWRVLEAWSERRYDIGDLEPYDAFVARVRAAVASIVARHPERGAQVAAVTSGGPIAIAVQQALALDGHATFKVWRVVRNASITELRWRSAAPQELSVLGLNHVDHLAAEQHTYR